MDDATGLAEALLGLDGFRVLAVEETPSEVVVMVETTTDFVGCATCGVRAEARDRLRVDIRDLPCFGRPARLVLATRTGMEPAIAAHKFVAGPGVLGKADDMHAIIHSERDATSSQLDDFSKRMVEKTTHLSTGEEVRVMSVGSSESAPGRTAFEFWIPGDCGETPGQGPVHLIVRHAESTVNMCSGSLHGQAATQLSQ